MSPSCRQVSRQARCHWWTMVVGVAFVSTAMGVCAARENLGPQGGTVQQAGLAACGPWERWDTFKQTFILPNGRVTDAGPQGVRTVSEGQAYALFFALVANDRSTFGKVLAATQSDLAGGDLARRLPAWLWGRRPDGRLGVLDHNSASDADLWLAYSLLQAGRLWLDPRLTSLGASVARQILSREVAELPGLGWTVLPGADGFHPGTATWRLNPSYLPPQVLRGIASDLPKQWKWPAVATSSLRVLLETAPHGYAPDWVLYRGKGGSQGFAPDPASQAEGAYNAIRVYLWAGMFADEKGDAARLLNLYRPMVDYVRKHGFPPEKVDTARGVSGKNAGNAGFSAAVVPFLLAQAEPDLAEAQIDRVRRLEARSPLGYYSQALSLFGLGWQEGRFRFSADGHLIVAWRALCGGEAR